MIGAGTATGHPDKVSSKSVKACGQETVFCGAKKEEDPEEYSRQRAVARCLIMTNTLEVLFCAIKSIVSMESTEFGSDFGIHVQQNKQVQDPKTPLMSANRSQRVKTH